MKLIIPGELVDLNTYINAERGNRYAGAGIKSGMTSYVSVIVKRLKNEDNTIKTPVRINFTWYTKDLKKDPDNIAFAKKFILDGLVKAKLLENDTRKYIKGFTDSFAVDPKDPRVEVEITEVEKAV